MAVFNLSVEEPGYAYLDVTDVTGIGSSGNLLTVGTVVGDQLLVPLVDDQGGPVGISSDGTYTASSTFQYRILDDSAPLWSDWLLANSTAGINITAAMTLGVLTLSSSVEVAIGPVIRANIALGVLTLSSTSNVTGDVAGPGVGKSPELNMPVIPIFEDTQLLEWARAMSVAVDEGDDEIVAAIQELNRRLAALETLH